MVTPRLVNGLNLLLSLIPAHTGVTSLMFRLAKGEIKEANSAIGGVLTEKHLKDLLTHRSLRKCLVPPGLKSGLSEVWTGYCSVGNQAPQAVILQRGRLFTENSRTLI